MLTENFASLFAPTRGYLSACTMGLPSYDTAEAMRNFLDSWTRGETDAAALWQSAEETRREFGRLVHVDPSQIALGTLVSPIAAIVATGVPDGAEVLAAAGDFSSLTHPFEQLAARGVTVRYAPVSSLATEIRPETSLVAFSLVQSATGEVAEAEAIAAAAAAVGARTFVDLTQAAGWLPVDASQFDFTVTHAYKWLCAPRGTSFLTIRPGLEDSLTPIAAGWASAPDVWASCYAGHTPLAPDAGRFDVSPVWPSVDGTLTALRMFTETVSVAAVHQHDLRLANAAREVLGLPSGNSAIVTWPDPDGEALARLGRAGMTASGRAGNARIAFHLWNDEHDVHALARALHP